jgi:hypothetical protein
LDPVGPRLAVRADIDAGVSALDPVDRHAVLFRPPVDDVAVGIAEQQVAVGHPDGTFDELESVGQLLEPRVATDDAVEGGMMTDDGCRHHVPGRFGPEDLEDGRAHPDEVGRRVRQRSVDSEHRNLELFPGNGVPGEKHAIGRVEAGGE